jgi:diguanylate cyclase (GGDEF)-like protein
MDDSSSQAVVQRHEEVDTHTDDIDLQALRDAGLTQACSTAAHGLAEARSEVAIEANVILIAHPEGRRLGSRFRLAGGRSLEIGRDPELGISIPDVLSISRRHAVLRYTGRAVTLEDLGSTNGTYVNDQLIRGRTVLKSGDRFQVAAVHFKFLHEQDVEHAYYEAISDLVTRDGLTEVYNKRKFEEEAEREWARAVRYRRPLALIAFDLDDFKTINDSYGHLCGDFVLKQVTNLVREALRPEQMLARVGGDEFAVLCPETDAEGARSLAERLRETVAGLDYRYCDFRISVTCSFGVAQRHRSMARHPDLYHAADRALYECKRAGRNRTSVYVPEATGADASSSRRR